MHTLLTERKEKKRKGSNMRQYSEGSAYTCYFPAYRYKIPKDEGRHENMQRRNLKMPRRLYF